MWRPFRILLALPFLGTAEAGAVIGCTYTGTGCNAGYAPNEIEQSNFEPRAVTVVASLRRRA